MNPNYLKITVANTPEEAPNYARDTPDVRSVDIEEAVVVGKGMVSGKATVDFIIKTQDGAVFVGMLTGSIIRNLVAVIDGVESRQ